MWGPDCDGWPFRLSWGVRWGFWDLASVSFRWINRVRLRRRGSAWGGSGVRAGFETFNKVTTRSQGLMETKVVDEGRKTCCRTDEGNGGRSWKLRRWVPGILIHGPNQSGSSEGCVSGLSFTGGVPEDGKPHSCPWYHVELKNKNIKPRH